MFISPPKGVCLKEKTFKLIKQSTMGKGCGKHVLQIFPQKENKENI